MHIASFVFNCCLRSWPDYFERKSVKTLGFGPFQNPFKYGVFSHFLWVSRLIYLGTTCSFINYHVGGWYWHLNENNHCMQISTPTKLILFCHFQHHISHENTAWTVFSHLRFSFVLLWLYIMMFLVRAATIIPTSLSGRFFK